ncbi:MAG: hypothetical protein A2527_01080 [Candidatus Lambdaproteobacteria bacterium RIFOXYD2_FULL_50_16]|uniref:Uncharacterized protein n=1 Tax=Candidatus Lambdaproteobacteria bacterium RIFOXYD2_FULL_50_16 TaxID=1817772 RepID=A0A1F6G9M9_9PROT|nr:MAG: hypothetical protein A2527_01080 [Candidatus Lambdaproteobacteria bacterium RIFOXYD2_FULL_50_16]
MSPETKLFRQIHPSWIQGGRVTSQAFKPTPKDEKQLSVDDGGQITPPDSFQHFTEVLKCPSCGVMAVTHAECSEINLDVIPDPKPYPAHTLIDFSKLGTTQIEKHAKVLRSKAQERDWLYQSQAPVQPRGQA